MVNEGSSNTAKPIIFQGATGQTFDTDVKLQKIMPKKTNIK